MTCTGREKELRKSSILSVPLLFMGNSRIDFVVRVGQRIAAIEVKYKLPESGEALSRVINQANNMIAWGQGQAVIWSAKLPTPAELTEFESALGDAAGKVKIIPGVDGLYFWAQQYFQGY